MSSEIIVCNSINELYPEESLELLQFLQISEEELTANSEKFEAILSDHIKYVLKNSKSWEIKRLGEGFQWLNTAVPLDFHRELQNKVVILDFFTYCCINCEHVLPIIHHVKEKYENNPELVVISVHSPKHPNEKDKASVENALKRNGISQPVINDCENKLWSALDLNCWPSVLVVGPGGKVLLSLMGETAIQKLELVCGITLAAIGGPLDTSPLPPPPAGGQAAPSLLLYPGGISCHKGSHPKILVSDTGHNRLLLMTADGEVLDVIGDGTRGMADGPFASCSFNSPRGSEWLSDELALVADTANNCIRLIDLSEKRVSVLDPRGNDGGRLLSNDDDDSKFKSPWDVCLVPGNEALDTVYIAAAGSHQIWAFHVAASFSTKKLVHSKYFAFAGTGKEECRNNHYRRKAGFAQPSGLCAAAAALCVVDSESSSLRHLSLPSGAVRTLLGGDKDPTELFCFGDMDGEGSSVKLQHPLAVCAFMGSKVLLTDSYNHKVKVVDIQERSCSTLAGSGTKGSSEGRALEAQFDEPGGICHYNNTVLVADTNNHCVKVIDLEQDRVKTMPITFPTAPCCVDGPVWQSMAGRLQPQGRVSFVFVLEEAGVSLSEGAPQLWTVSFEGGWDWSVCCEDCVVSGRPSLRLRCLRASSARCAIGVQLAFSVCQQGSCLLRRRALRLQLELSESGDEHFQARFVV